MTSTTAADTPTGRAARRFAPALLAAAFWIAVWQVAAVVVGFTCAAIVGGLLAVLSSASRIAEALAAPLIATIRSVPVVSFIILLLLWTDSSRLAAWTSFLMVFPIMYANMLAGIRNRDRALLEAAQVFRVPWLRRVRAIDVPSVLPFFAAACKAGVGLAWKSGVAAEVIGVARGTIGERLYEAKLFLESADLFAWTIVIVALSVVGEAVVLWGLRRAQARFAAGGAS
jgi:NitT/TauT family transport system permease protein